ncbi:hypothetical protein [Allorhizobium ampelinum]|uniref:hypothetical protein n=1 Tax=Allorhizobium ampelinum TaxID=3025782 RepID=UPI000B3F8872|nr:hypothetical protein [Allorhizobium ampelinum]NTA27448.1 hypothetical protein [Allorhizobium ampelinum]OVE94603.1 hypothetical protein B7W85_13210 [Allorhizobium ampelinum]
MNDTTTETRQQVPSLQSGGSVKAIVPQDFDGAWRIAKAVVTAGMAPKGLDTPEKAMVAIMHGLEVGLTPMAALQSIAVVNGRPTIWGDGALGLVQGSGKLESHKEWYEGEGENKKAICTVKRKGDPEVKRGEFSVGNAKKAGLWGKAGPWTQYADRMLMMRARGFALRDGFSDVLRGLGIAEEVQDTPVMRDITPPVPPKPPTPPAPPTHTSDPVVEHTASSIDTDQQEDTVTLDGEILGPKDKAEEFDVTDFLNALETELAEAPTREDLEEAWVSRDPMAVLEGREEDQAIALGIKKRILKKFGN